VNEQIKSIRRKGFGLILSY